VGVLLGGGVAVWMMTELSLAMSVGRAELDLGQLSFVAAEIDAERMESARRRLDLLIDSALLTFGALRNGDQPVSSRTAATLTRIREQRRQTGYVPDEAIVATAVAEALAASSAAAQR